MRTRSMIFPNHAARPTRGLDGRRATVEQGNRVERQRMGPRVGAVLVGMATLAAYVGVLAAGPAAPLTVASPAGDAAVSASSTTVSAPATPEPSGEDLYRRDCATCHGTGGAGSYRGPDIRHAGTAAVDFQVSTGRMPLADTGELPERSAPAYSPEQIGALVAYTSSFVDGPTPPVVPPATRDLVARGGEAYRLNCASCHQASGAGGVLAFGVQVPSLGHATPTQVVEAMRTGP